ncbi:MAG: hypothetical protein CSA76_04225 [Spirochaetales bacterium]|nr:MAG: hypothetical protein CSA76_04225 [Spirochaetales bacterium]
MSKTMTKIILADFEHPAVQQKANELTAGVESRRIQIQKIFKYVRDDILFGYPLKGDLVSASETMRLGTGQCNTKSALFLALCKAADIPARIHFSAIKKEIQRGLFKGPAYRAMPDKISHSWIEVLLDGKWRKIDAFINDIDFFNGAKKQLELLNWQNGFSVSSENGEPSAELDLDNEKFVQMGAVVDDHGVWEEPMAYYSSEQYKNRPGFIKLLFYRLLIGVVNKRVVKLRQNGARLH